MSNHNPPASGGLFINFAGKNVGIWCEDTPVGPILLAATLDSASGWLAFWTHGPKPNGDWQSECDMKGGIIALIKSLLAEINAAFQATFNPPVPVPPPVGTPFSIDAMNAALAASFTLGAGTTAPVISAKP